ncbi:MAG: NAD(P)/FAD-dependent oxidoreductase [Bacteroidia bacterium]|nr:NAD(P)/FAD-dependent oxidoreductase [Bacteroidia bacterium]
MEAKRHQVVILGGGTAGIMLAATLKRTKADLDIAIVEPSEKHYYQPAYTLVGAGTYKLEKCVRDEADYIPKGTTWIKDFAEHISPDNNEVILRKQGKIKYDVLVVATGVIFDNSLIEGLQEALDKGIVCSNYVDPNKTWELLQKFQGGNLIFTQSNTPIKCGGAPQKAAYLSADYLRRKKLAQPHNIMLVMPGSVIFGVKIIAESLLKKVEEYKIHLKLGLAPIKIDSTRKTVTFKNVLATPNKYVDENPPVFKVNKLDQDTIEVPFDFLHLAPPQTTHKFVKESGLTNAQGWVDVNINSLQHNRYPNVFSLGDAAALPTAKTGAAIRKQVPVVVDNIISFLEGKPVQNFGYEGYSSCPLTTGYGEMVLAEFNYKNEFTPDPKLKMMLISKSYKPHWRLWILKKHILPYLYWNKMLKGIPV